MKVLFLITTVGHGNGGHFYSLHTIAEEIARDHSVTIVNIGKKQSPVLVGKGYKAIFRKYTGWNFFQVAFELLRIVREQQFDAIHAFDIESFAFSRLASYFAGKDSFLNKCGGGNPARYYPCPDQLIVFSDENLSYFQNQKKFKSAKISLIPNRVARFSEDQLRIRDFLRKHQMTGWKIIRISRISPHYEGTLIQCIDLMDGLRGMGVNATLAIVGTIQSATVLARLEERVNQLGLQERVLIESSEYFAADAKRLLALADMAICTGRGFMEACSIGMKVMVPTLDLKYPVVVNRSNFKCLFDSNFSPRGVVPGLTDSENLKDIARTLEAPASVDSAKWFEEYFDVTTGAKKYLAHYAKQSGRKGLNIVDSIINSAYSVKSLISSNRPA